MKILIAEDDLKTARYLQKGLSESGYSAEIFSDGYEAFLNAKEDSKKYDLLILDVMLPMMSGFEILKKLREEGIATLAIFLTAKDGVQDRINGLNYGADAYLIKPFSFSELLAIMKSLFRRNEGSLGKRSISDSIEIHDIVIDFQKHQVKRRGILLELTPIEFKLLVLMARKEGEVLTRTIILEHIWDINFECQTNIVDVHVRRLRAKLDEPFDQPLIQTIRGVGYSLRNQSY